MASAIFNRMQEELEVLYEEYTSLLQEFQRNGGPELFVELDERLMRLSDRAYGLSRPEEKLGIQHGVDAIRDKIKSLLYS